MLLTYIFLKKTYFDSVISFLQEVFADIFAFDWHDRKLREQLGQVLLGCGFRGFEVFQGKGKQHGNAKRRLPKEIFGVG